MAASRRRGLLGRPRVQGRPRRLELSRSSAPGGPGRETNSGGLDCPASLRRLGWRGDRSEYFGLPTRVPLGAEENLPLSSGPSFVRSQHSRDTPRNVGVARLCRSASAPLAAARARRAASSRGGKGTSHSTGQGFRAFLSTPLSHSRRMVAWGTRRAARMGVGPGSAIRASSRDLKSYGSRETRQSCSCRKGPGN